jgi:protein TonB
MSSRIPLLDESSLDKFGNSPMLNSQQETVDEEYPPSTLIPLETKNLRYFSFFTKVKHQIEQSKYYPKEAVKDLLSGAVTVSLEINRNGSLGDVKVTSSSGKDILDEAALDIVQRATPFPNVPSRINHTPLKVATSIMFIPTPEVIQRQEGLGLSIPMK